MSKDSKPPLQGLDQTPVDVKMVTAITDEPLGYTLGHIQWDTKT
jgi:hypothetical protein